MHFQALKRVFLPSLMLASLLACTTGADPGDEDAGRRGIGSACSVDEECGDGTCLGGICTRRNTASSGTVVTGSSTSAGSGVGSSGATSGASSAAPVSSSRGPMGHITFDPSPGPVEFGAVRIGAAVSSTVTITNTGNAAVSIITVGFRENASNEFTFTVVGGMQPTTLAPQEQFNIRITHTATDATADHAFLSIISSADNAVAELPLAAEFKNDPVLMVVPTPTGTTEVTDLQLPATPVNTPVVQQLFIKNAGPSDSALTVQSVTLDPFPSARFSVEAGPMPRSVSSYPGPCADVASCLTPGAASCLGGLCLGPQDQGALPLDVVAVVLTFNAGVPGDASTTLVITTLVAGQAVTRRIPVTALAQENRLDVSPNPVAFGDVFVGRTKSLQVTIKNPDDAAAVVTLDSVGMRFTPSGYTVGLGGLTFPYPLTPGSSIVATVSFSSPVESMANNSLAIGRAGSLPLYIPVTAAAVPQPVISVPAELDVGGAIPGQPRLQALLVRNTGLGPLAIQTLSIQPPTAPFMVTPAAVAAPVAAMGSTMLTISYSPAMVGDLDTATLAIESNDPDTPTAYVSLRGRGVTPGALVSPTALDFLSVLVGSMPVAEQVITVSNTGSGDMEVRSPLRVLNASNQDVAGFVVTPSRVLPASVTGGDSMTFRVTFSPASVAQYAGALTITTSDPSKPTFTIPITGAGNNCAPLPNSTVTVVNGTMCSYMCQADSVQCSDNSCVSCPARHAANTSCTGNHMCTYSCPSNTGEATDPGATCTAAYNLGDVQDGNGRTTTNFRIFPAGDHDWFKFRMRDRLDLFHEGFLPFTTINSIVRLGGVPPGEQLAFEVMQDSCGGGGTPQTVGAGGSAEIQGAQFCDNYGVDANDNVIPVDDSRTYYVHVFPVGDSYACSSYELTIDVNEEFFSGFCL